jgi:hypothetical protein
MRRIPDRNILRRAQDSYAVFVASHVQHDPGAYPLRWNQLSEADRIDWYAVAQRSLELAGAGLGGSGEQANPPGDGTFGHLADRDEAIGVWRTYSGIA